MNKQLNIFASTLAAGALATGLMLSASTAQAATVVLDGSNNVLRINNLELDFDQDELDGFYDVEFVTGTGNSIYGPDGDFDFANAENVATALIQVNNALNLNKPVPGGAGAVGSDQFLAPALDFTRFGIWAAFGSENIADLWTDCESDCLGPGVTALMPDDINTTFAKFSEASTNPVPVPAAVWLFGSGLLGLIGIARRKKTA